jgi:hypothetical protein
MTLRKGEDTVIWRVAGRRGRRRRKLLDDLKERRGYCHLKEEPLDRTMWRDRFGRGFGPVVRQTAEWINEFGYTLFLKKVLQFIYTLPNQSDCFLIISNNLSSKSFSWSSAVHVSASLLAHLEGCLFQVLTRRRSIWLKIRVVFFSRFKQILRQFLKLD